LLSGSLKLLACCALQIQRMQHRRRVRCFPDDLLSLLLWGRYRKRGSCATVACISVAGGRMACFIVASVECSVALPVVPCRWLAVCRGVSKVHALCTRLVWGSEVDGKTFRKHTAMDCYLFNVSSKPWCVDREGQYAKIDEDGNARRSDHARMLLC
jgi:hypothetical protein